MKFGLFTHLPWPEGASPGEVVHETTDQVCLAEELGYCGAWFAETAILYFQ